MLNAHWHVAVLLQVCLDVSCNHHACKLIELHCRLPAEDSLCLCSVAEECRYLCRSLIAIVCLEEIEVIQPDEREALLKEFAYSVRLLCRDDKVIRLVVLHDVPHRLDVL